MDINNNQLELFLTLEGYEGPIDLLLKLAREQKVDLSFISIVDLADQYIEFINNVNDIEIAADYLIMASWLVFLKSKLLLPNFEEETDDDNLDIFSDQLKDSLIKLQAMQKAGKKLLKLPQLGSEIFPRGIHEIFDKNIIFDFNVNLNDLIKAYSKIQNSSSSNKLTIEFSKMMTVEDAMKSFKNLYSIMDDWVPFSDLFIKNNKNFKLSKNHIASHFAASLDLVKKGEINIFQNLHFDTLWIKNSKEIKTKD